MARVWTGTPPWLWLDRAQRLGSRTVRSRGLEPEEEPAQVVEHHASIPRLDTVRPVESRGGVVEGVVRHRAKLEGVVEGVLDQEAQRLGGAGGVVGPPQAHRVHRAPSPGLGGAGAAQAMLRRA